MNHQLLPINRFSTSACCIFSVAMLICAAQQAAAVTALDTYVEKFDSTTGFTVAATTPGTGFTSYNIDLTSQTWRDPSEVTQVWKTTDDPLQNQWNHKMTIVQPDQLNTNTAILFINGGSGPGDFVSGSDFLIATEAAKLTRSVFVNLPMVPNERLQFAGEKITRTEDEIIAKTFKKFLDNDPTDNNVDEWPLLLPMVKSAVAAMDATQAHLASLDEPINIDKFFVFGGSKRGWTTWLTAAVEARPGGPNRISGIGPAVIDFLNVDESMKHHRNVYKGVTEKLIGGFTQSVGDYVVEGVMQQLAPLPVETLSPRAQELLDIIDPFEYRDRLTLPKYIVNSTGDQFFAPDSSKFYYDELSGEKYLRYIPNTDHGLDSSAIEGALVFKTALDLGIPLPDYTSVISEDGTSITVNTDIAPTAVKLWQATNPVNRDFRVETFGANWTESPLTEQAAGEYLASVSIPATGATAFMIEMTYLIAGQELKFTSGVSVVGVPEPASCALLLSGLAAGLLSVRRFGSRSARPSRGRSRRGRVPRATICG